MDAMADRLTDLHDRQLKTALKLGEFERKLTVLSADLSAISAELHEEAHELANITTVGRSWRVFLGIDEDALVEDETNGPALLCQ